MMHGPSFFLPLIRAINPVGRRYAGAHTHIFEHNWAHELIRPRGKYGCGASKFS